MNFDTKVQKKRYNKGLIGIFFILLHYDYNHGAYSEGILTNN